MQYRHEQAEMFGGEGQLTVWWGGCLGLVRPTQSNHAIRSFYHHHYQLSSSDTKGWRDGALQSTSVALYLHVIRW